ncbi:MAG: hypothetical protein ACFCU1_00720 [Sumerlaeia bacterium]
MRVLNYVLSVLILLLWINNATAGEIPVSSITNNNVGRTYNSFAAQDYQISVSPDFKTIIVPAKYRSPEYEGALIWVYENGDDLWKRTAEIIPAR